jgi:hypothetical protein
MEMLDEVMDAAEKDEGMHGPFESVADLMMNLNGL